MGLAALVYVGFCALDFAVQPAEALTRHGNDLSIPAWLPGTPLLTSFLGNYNSPITRFSVATQFTCLQPRVTELKLTGNEERGEGVQGH